MPTDKSGGTVDVAQGARRLPYPVEEYQQNNANLQLAIQSLHETSDSIENSASSVNIKFCFIAVSCYKICNPTIHGFP